MSDATDPINRLNAALEGRYRVEREIGEGGMATVYLAEDLRHERKVALKVLKPELAAVVGAERFLAEIKTTANLQHPHILALYDSGEADSFLFFVGPYIEGDTLRAKIDREKQLGIEEALDITRKVASALDYAHEHGVVHRDIKPGNILLSEKGEPTVADFGIALAVAQAGGGRVTETGLSVGTPHYMSPEQATGDRDVDPRTDVYALGCVLYEMLIGDPPYGGSTAQAVLAKILTDPAPAPTKVRISIPPNVDAAIRKALEKLPADRFTTAQEFAGALADPGFRHGGAVAVAPAPGPWRPLAFIFAAASVALALVLGSSLRRPSASVGVWQNILSTQGWAGLDAQLGRQIALAPDGSSVILPVSLSEGAEGLGLKVRGSTEIAALPGTENAWDPTYSPDAQWILYGVAPNQLYKRRLSGGSPILLADDVQASRGAVVGLSWLDDGTILYEQIVAEAERPRRVVRIPENGGEPLEIVFWPEEAAMSIVWLHGLPNGRGALVGGCRGTVCPAVNTEMYIVDFEDLSWRVLIDQALRAWYVPSARQVVYVQADGAVLTRGFDLNALEFTSPQTPLFDGVSTEINNLSGYPDMVLGADGTLLYVERQYRTFLNAELDWVSRSGVREPVDTTWRFPSPRGQGTVALSPAGTRVAVTAMIEGNEDIWVKDLADGPFQRLTSGTEGERHPSWSPDGRSVIYSRFDQSGTYNIWLADADGSSAPALLLDDERSLSQLRWSRDGEWIVARTVGLGQGLTDIVGFRPGEDTAAVPLVALPESAENYPALSHDGRWLAYTSDQSGQDEVYVRPFPNLDSQRGQISTNGGVGPLWSHGGDELFFVDSERQLVAVRLDGLRPVSREALFTIDPEYRVSAGYDFYDISPDGQRFLMERLEVEETGEIEGSVILVQNFFEELRQVVPDN